MRPLDMLDTVIRLWAKPKKYVPWEDRAMKMLTSYAEMCRMDGKYFSADDFRQYALKKGLPRPDKQSSWGSLFTKARLGMVIFHTGSYETSTRPTAKGRKISLWC